MDGETEPAINNDAFVVHATNVPSEFFGNRDATKKYFRSFGKVKLVSFKPKRTALIIEYADEQGMLNALELCGEYNGQHFNLARHAVATRRKRRQLKRNKDLDPDWTADPEIRSELEAMGGVVPRSYDLRSDAMIVDPPVSRSKQRKWKSGLSVTKLKKPQMGNKNVLSSEEPGLLSIIKQHALTSEEKFKILDARDKLIRIRLKKSIEFSKVSATVGTCPDMCPEKERLMREVQHQVALYEQEEGGRGMNPHLAIKQYSRSSADQEAPLPQELRPVGVLQMTMGYLMHRILDLCDAPDVNIAEWYHFLWDRTRGIRKDITQQELCCRGSVELVQQCARFHIFCSARLVSEDPSVFDQKINTENLTKCLQTLKYMYHDLQVKGQKCENEAEFRAYIILLNLNDGNFMWEVQQLPKDIQQSKEVKFALEVYSSLDKTNYVKFFKLVNSTTFLNSCILMRYFIQVRLSAVKTLLKSYSPRVSQTALPVSYITKILGFEHTESTIEFFETYGLYTDVERSRIVLDRHSFTDPEYPYVLDRSIRLVESKRRSSIGEVVCGKKLPPKTFEHHVPQDSFSSDGYLMWSAEIDEADSVMSEPVKIESEPEEVVITSSPVTVLATTDYPSIFSSSDSTFSIFTSPGQNEFKPEIFGSVPFKNLQEEGQVSSSKSLWSDQNSSFKPVDQKNIFGGDIVPLAPPVDEEFDEDDETMVVESSPEVTPTQVELEEQERRRREQEEEEENARKLEEERQMAELKEKLLQDTLRRREKARRAAEMEKQREEQRRKEREDLKIRMIVKNAINELLDNVEECVKEQKLSEISQRIHERRVRSAANKWRENTASKRKRKALDFNPPWFGGTSSQEVAEEFRTSCQNLALASIKRYKRGYAYDIPVVEQAIHKIDLPELTHKLLCKKYLELEGKLRTEHFWKVTVSIPNETEFSCGLNHVENVLEQCFKWKERNSSTVLMEQSKFLPIVTYCLQKQKGLVVSKRNHTNGFIFIAKDINDHFHRRLAHNFKNYGVFIKIPIVLVLQNYDEKKCNLKTLIEEGIISDYLIIVDKFTSRTLVNVLEEALIFLATRVEKSPPLEMDTLKSFLTKYLCTNVWKRVRSFSKWNSTYKSCLKAPNTVIGLYNEAVRRLKAILLDESCREHSRFPEMLKECLRNEIPDALPCDYKYFPSFWDEPLYLEHLEELLDGLTLPNFLENWPPTNQLQMELGISKYCTQIVKQPQALFYKTMSVLLRNVDPLRNFKDVCEVVWVDVVELFAIEKLTQTNFSLYGTGFTNKSLYNQMVVVYDVRALDGYVKSDWFYIDNPIIKQKILIMLQEERGREELSSNSEEFEDLDIDTIFRKIQEPSKQDVGAITKELKSCKTLLDDLESSVVIHKKILETSGQFLKSVLEK